MTSTAAGELAQTNEILHTMLSDIGDGVVAADTDGNFIVFNPAAERMFGGGALRVPPSEWSRRYGLFLPDKVTPFPENEIPLLRSIRGEEVNNAEMYVRNETVPEGIW